MPLLEKDGYQFQRARIERIVAELAPGKAVEFNEASTLIKFGDRDNTLGINLTEPSGNGCRANSLTNRTSGCGPSSSN